MEYDRKSFDIPKEIADPEIEAVYLLQQIFKSLTSEETLLVLRYFYERTQREALSEALPRPAASEG